MIHEFPTSYQPANYHCHSRFDDGHGELEEYVQAALHKGLRTLGFAGHAPVPFPCTWTMPSDLLPEYLETARRLKIAYAEKLEVLVGLEVDYIPELISTAAAQIQALNLDFTVGSVHFIGRLAAGKLWTPDGPVEELEQGVQESFGGDIRRAVEEYYRRMTAMVSSSPPDIIGHFDVIKKNNRGDGYFSESSTWYRSAVEHTLDAVAVSPCILEINTGGIVRNTSGVLYPSEWILAESLRREIPVMINSDAHRPDQLDGYYNEAVSILREIGFRELTQIGREGRRRVPL
jgi:histidinol-phosphatase (PHP family)